jgi:hypothetical protein
MVREFHLNSLRSSGLNPVGTATCNGMDAWGSNPDRCKRSFSTPRRPDWLWGQSSLLSKEYQGFFPGGKAAGREADHSLPCKGEIKNGGAIPPFPVHN